MCGGLKNKNLHIRKKLTKRTQNGGDFFILHTWDGPKEPKKERFTYSFGK